MAMQNKNQYTTLIQALKDQRKEAEDSIKELLDEPLRYSLDELSVVDNHPADHGTELYFRSQDIARRDKLMGQIAAIDAALKSYEEGRYGFCEHCGAEIPVERLEIIPYTTVCKDCSKEEEDQEMHTFYQEQPETGLLNHPFARSFQDELNFTGFDGEDAWQAVAQYGTSDTLQDLGTNEDISDPTFNYEDSEEIIGAVEDIDTLETITGPDGTHYSNHHGRSSRHVRIEE